MRMTIDQPWLQAAPVQKVLALLNTGGGQARVSGGAVRNALLDQPVGDVDIATALLPDEVIQRAEENGVRAVPTGYEHGTVTLVVDGQAFEVTTLRADVETDGRHAVVRFGTDWTEDARRRDLTMNALYCEADGTVFDPLDGRADVEARRVRFIGDARSRIREDRLRILRFFRFFAWYGAFRPDADGLRACVKEKNGLRNLSAERIWQELIKLLAAPDPSRALLWMRQTGVLSVVLEESEQWGIDGIHPLIQCEQENGWESDAMLRLMAIIPPMPARVSSLSKRLKVPNRVRDRLTAWASCRLPDEDENPDADGRIFLQWAYWQDRQAIIDRLHLAIAKSPDDVVADTARRRMRDRLSAIQNWERPVFPVRGADLIAAGMEPGPKISERMQILERAWVKSHFTLQRDALLVT